MIVIKRDNIHIKNILPVSKIAVMVLLAIQYCSLTAFGEPITNYDSIPPKNNLFLKQTESNNRGHLVVAAYNAIFTTPPKKVPTEFMADGPLLGNGDAAVVMAGPPEEMRFFIGKNDFWSRISENQHLSTAELADGKTKFAHTKNAGRLFIRIPALKNGSYKLEQSLASGEVTGSFTKGNLSVHTVS